MTKYRNTKVQILGRTFDSKKEAERYLYLKDLESLGKIANLKCQVKYQLLPNQYANNKCVERKICYIADFVYTKDGETIVEDVKGYRSSEAYNIFVIKRKLMLYTHGITVREV